MRPPAYLDALGVLPSWKVSEEERSSLPYRCRRLRGLVNLYHWAMQWTIHRANDWQLGEERLRFTLGQKELWLLGVETVADLAGAGWDSIADEVGVRNREPPQRHGSIRLADVYGARMATR